MFSRQQFVLHQPEVGDREEAELRHREGVHPVVIGRVPVAPPHHEDEPGQHVLGDAKPVHQSQVLDHGEDDGRGVGRVEDAGGEG